MTLSFTAFLSTLCLAATVFLLTLSAIDPEGSPTTRRHRLIRTLSQVSQAPAGQRTRLPSVRNERLWLSESGLPISWPDYQSLRLAFAVFLALVALLSGLVTHSGDAALAAFSWGIISYFLPYLGLGYLARRRRQRLDATFPRFVTDLGRYMAAGLTASSALAALLPTVRPPLRPYIDRLATAQATGDPRLVEDLIATAPTGQMSDFFRAWLSEPDSIHAGHFAAQGSLFRFLREQNIERTLAGRPIAITVVCGLVLIATFIIIMYPMFANIVRAYISG